MKKIYVASGNLRWIGHADSPIQAIKKALGATSQAPQLDLNIYLDERGFRDDETARYKVPV